MRLLYACVLLLAACDKPNYIGDDYTARLANVLQVAPSLSTSLTITYPRHSELQSAPTTSTLSIREFLALRQCRLHTILAHRNSLIGKVATASQLLFNDLDILATGPDCLEQLDNPQLAAKLRRFLNLKRESIDAALWSAIFAQTEHRGFWQIQPPPQDYPLVLHQETSSSLATLQSFVSAVKAGQFEFSEVEKSQLEVHLGQLRFGDGGQLLFEYLRLSQALQQADALIEQRVSRPLCLQPKPTPSAHYFQNVVNTRFIAQIQPYAVRLNQRESQLMTSYRVLENELLHAAPKAYLEWRQQRERVIQQGKQAARRHVGQIQTLYQQCGLSTGSRPA